MMTSPNDDTPDVFGSLAALHLEQLERLLGRKLTHRPDVLASIKAGLEAEAREGT